MDSTHTQTNIHSQNTNPYLDNPELNYTIDKAKRNYQALTLRYNIPDWDDLLKIPIVSNQETEINLNNSNFEIYDNSIQNESQNFEPQADLSQGLINTTLANLKPIQTQNNEEFLHSNSKSPEISGHVESHKPIESTAESHIENKTEINPEKDREKTIPKILPKLPVVVDKKLDPTVISSMIGKFNLYGYSPSAAIINKLIHSKNPQTAWKVFPTSSAKSWLYALTGRLIAIHSTKK